MTTERTVPIDFTRTVTVAHKYTRTVTLHVPETATPEHITTLGYGAFEDDTTAHLNPLANGYAERYWEVVGDDIDTTYPTDPAHFGNMYALRVYTKVDDQVLADIIESWNGGFTFRLYDDGTEGLIEDVFALVDVFRDAKKSNNVLVLGIENAPKTDGLAHHNV